MKKHYLSFGLVYCILALLIFSAVMSFYTKKKTDLLNDNLRSASHFPQMLMGISDDTDLGSVVGKTVGAWEFLSCLDDDIGFYSSVVDTRNKGRVLFESQNFLEVDYYGEYEIEIIENSSERYEERTTQTVYGESRYMFIEEPLSLKKDEATELSISRGRNVLITGARCDDTFIYGGTLTYTYDDKTTTYTIAVPDFVNEAESIPYEEWIVRLDALEYYSIGGNSGISRKAHKLSDAYVDKYLNGKVSAAHIIKEGVFTTTAAEIFVFDKGRYIVTYYFVMNPLQIVIRDNIKTYFLAVLALAFVEAVIIYVVRKLYLNQKSFELRSEKLTKGIAYDLKGPLAITREYLDNWENADEDKRSEYSEKIISEVDHMSSLVTRLLELSKIHDGSVKLNREDVDLLLLTRNIKKRNSKAISDKKIDLTIDCDEITEAYTVYADLEMIYIVINNFMTNAIKYCDHTIRIRLNKIGRRIEFGITNDGAGIENADLDKVWDVRYNSRKGRSEPDENSGVGLSVVKDILDAHNAKYGCYSGAKGTNFWFSMDAYDERSFS